MNWWHDALYDTCSLITVDKMLLDDPSLTRFFPAMRSIEPCLSKDQLHADVAQRMRRRLTIEELPPLDVLLSSIEGLSASLSETDKTVYATAVHRKMAVVTGDEILAKALQQGGIAVGNVAVILRNLVNSRDLSTVDCDTILAALDARQDIIIPPPQTWTWLRGYKFP